MSELRKSIDEFRDAMRHEGEHAPSLSLAAILERNHSPRWAVAAIVLLTLGGGLGYREVKRAQAAQQEKKDTLLMHQINAELSRPVARALSPLVGN